MNILRLLGISPTLLKMKRLSTFWVTNFILMVSDQIFSMIYNKYKKIKQTCINMAKAFLTFGHNFITEFLCKFKMHSASE